MKCPKCESDNFFGASYAYHCSDCHYSWTEHQQSRIDTLKKKVEMYEAMKEGFTERIQDKEKELSTAQESLRKADIIIKGFIAIVNDSRGVDGYHLNGNIAEWGEFEEPALAEEYIQKHPAKKPERS